MNIKDKNIIISWLGDTSPKGIMEDTEIMAGSFDIQCFIDDMEGRLKAMLVYDIWKNECACGATGCPPADCGGPPNALIRISVRRWIVEGGEAPDIHPFRDPEFWDGCIKREQIG